MSVDDVAKQLDKAAGLLPIKGLDVAADLVEQAVSTLDVVVGGSQDKEIADAVERLRSCPGEIGRTLGLCLKVQQEIATYRASLTGDTGGSVEVPPSPPTPQPTKPTQPEPEKRYRTATEELGGVKYFLSYSAAKRALGSRPKEEIHHVVEQNQGAKKRDGTQGYSGFPEDQINCTDNLVRLPEHIHKRITRHYASNDRFLGTTPRRMLRGKSWDFQHRYGLKQIDVAFDKAEENDEQQR